jgi:hypothetical protein
VKSTMQLNKSIRAVLYGVWWAAKRHKVFSVFVTIFTVYMLVAMAWVALHPPPPKTPEQHRLRREALLGDIILRAEETQRKRSVCHDEWVCTQYGSARQECATAGNFDNCISVKMGDQDAALTGMCTNDGELQDPPTHLPNVVECLLLDVENELPKEKQP